MKRKPDDGFEKTEIDWFLFELLNKFKKWQRLSKEFFHNNSLCLNVEFRPVKLGFLYLWQSKRMVDKLLKIVWKNSQNHRRFAMCPLNFSTKECSGNIVM